MGQQTDIVLGPSLGNRFPVVPLADELLPTMSGSYSEVRIEQPATEFPGKCIDFKGDHTTNLGVPNLGPDVYLVGDHDGNPCRESLNDRIPKILLAAWENEKSGIDERCQLFPAAEHSDKMNPVT